MRFRAPRYNLCLFGLLVGAWQLNSDAAKQEVLRGVPADGRILQSTAILLRVPQGIMGDAQDVQLHDDDLLTEEERQQFDDETAGISFFAEPLKSEELLQSYDGALASKLAVLSQRASQASSGASLNLTDLGITSYKGYSVASDYALLGISSTACYVAFRGSTNSNWVGVDGNLNPSWADFRKNKGQGDIMMYSHRGFKLAYDNFRFSGSASTPFLNDVRDCLSSPSRSLILTGHSRGAALASLMAVQFVLDETLDLNDAEEKVYDLSRIRDQSNGRNPYLTIYTFGEPRHLSKGSARPREWLNVRNITTKFRLVNERDLVPSVPTNPFIHWGLSIHLTGGQVVREEENFPSFSFSGNVDDHDLTKYANTLAAQK